MARENFTACLAHVFKFEGGYVDHPRDPGGATNMGITHRTLAAHRRTSVSKQDVRDLTKAEAGEIYKQRYWFPVKGGDLPYGMDLVAFDGGVNSGPSRGAKWLQRALGVKADGAVGAKTLAAALNAPDGVKVIQRACAARMGFLKALGTWSTFGRGWSRRVASVEAEAVAMHTRDASVVAKQVKPAKRTAAQQDAAAAGSGGGGAATVTATDMSPWITYGVLVAALFLAIILVSKAAHSKRRAKAYEEKAKEMNDG